MEQTTHPYTSLPQSKKRKKVPYTWLTLLFLVVLSVVAVFTVNTLTVTHRTHAQQENTYPSGQ